MTHERIHSLLLALDDDRLDLLLLRLVRLDDIKDIDAVGETGRQIYFYRKGNGGTHSASTVLRTPACQEQMASEVGGA